MVPVFAGLVACIAPIFLPGCGTPVSPTHVEIPKLEMGTSLNSARVAEAYNDRIGVSGGTPPYVFTEYSGFPAGMTFDPSTGVISGTPLVAQAEGITLSFTVRDSGDPVQVVQQNAFLIIKPLGVSITTESLESGNYKVYYRKQIIAKDGLPTYTWKMGPAVGSLPEGLRLNSGTGFIEGIPTQREKQTFTVTVTDNDSPATSYSKEFTLEIQ
jgi:hypothetical protein